MVAVPNTRARLSHALTLRAGGRIIGAIHQWGPSQTRTIDTEYEVESHSVGLPADIIPQILDRREIRIARYDTYPEIMEEVFGSSELILLTDQYRPFSCREVWKGPGISPLGAAGSTLGNLSSLAGSLGLTGAQNAANQAQANLGQAIGAAAASPAGAAALTVLGTLTADIRIYEYVGCWFADVGRTIDAKGDRVISVDATLQFQGRRRVA